VGLRAYLGPQQAFHGGERYQLDRGAPSPMERAIPDEVHPERYVLLVETGDEVLDYGRR